MFNNMHKLDIISNVAIWIEMRGARNRVADDYLEVMLDRIYQDVAQKYLAELVYVKDTIKLKF